MERTVSVLYLEVTSHRKNLESIGIHLCGVFFIKKKFEQAEAWVVGKSGDEEIEKWKVTKGFSHVQYSHDKKPECSNAPPPPSSSMNRKVQTVHTLVVGVR